MSDVVPATRFEWTYPMSPPPAHLVMDVGGLTFTRGDHVQRVGLAEFSGGALHDDIVDAFDFPTLVEVPVAFHTAALGGSVDGSGAFTVRNARVLSTQLELARLRILQSCGRAKRDAKMIPLAARLRFLNARAAREGTDRQKTESLADLWIGSWWCELAAGQTK